VNALLTQKEAAHRLGISTRTLERYRTTGAGPAFTRLGKLVRYRPEDLIEFVNINRHRSTSEGQLSRLKARRDG
jgi:predicted site-specific integrase-resolvase